MSVTKIKAPLNSIEHVRQTVEAIQPFKLPADYLTSEEVATILRTNRIVINESRVTGKLFGRPAPLHIKLGIRKVVYKASTLIAWLEEIPEQRVVGA